MQEMPNCILIDALLHYKRPFFGLYFLIIWQLASIFVILQRIFSNESNKQHVKCRDQEGRNEEGAESIH